MDRKFCATATILHFTSIYNCYVNGVKLTFIYNCLLVYIAATLTVDVYLFAFSGTDSWTFTRGYILLSFERWIYCLITLMVMFDNFDGPVIPVFNICRNCVLCFRRENDRHRIYFSSEYSVPEFTSQLFRHLWVWTLSWLAKDPLPCAGSASLVIQFRVGYTVHVRTCLQLPYIRVHSYPTYVFAATLHTCSQLPYIRVHSYPTYVFTATLHTCSQLPYIRVHSYYIPCVYSTLCLCERWAVLCHNLVLGCTRLWHLRCKLVQTELRLLRIVSVRNKLGAALNSHAQLICRSLSAII